MYIHVSRDEVLKAILRHLNLGDFVVSGFDLSNDGVRIYFDPDQEKTNKVTFRYLWG